MTTALRAACEQCAGSMPILARVDARFCSSACRQASYRIRRARQQAQVEAERSTRVPVELTSRARWVRYNDRKVPMRVDGRYASVTDPSSWSDFATAADATAGEGTGFVLTAGDRIVVIDLDHAVELGQLRPWAQRIVDALPPTYMERGRSGTGLHLWFRGEVPAGRRIRIGQLAVEVYSDRRYIIIGDRVSGTPLELAELPDAAGVIASLV